MLIDQYTTDRHLPSVDLQVSFRSFSYERLNFDIVLIRDTVISCQPTVPFMYPFISYINYESLLYDKNGYFNRFELTTPPIILLIKIWRLLSHVHILERPFVQPFYNFFQIWVSPGNCVIKMLIFGYTFFYHSLHPFTHIFYNKRCKKHLI